MDVPSFLWGMAAAFLIVAIVKWFNTYFEIKCRWQTEPPSSPPSAPMSKATETPEGQKNY